MPSLWGLILSRFSRHERIEVCAFFGALCLLLSAVEYLIPKPLPFFRLGLANLPILLGLRFLKPLDLILVVFLKIFGQALLNGTLASHVFLFSAAGTLISVVTMSGVYRLGGRHVGLIGISLAGALASSSIQVLLAIALIFGEAARVIAPLSIGSGAAAGLLVGIFAERFVLKSTWLRQLEHRYAAGVDWKVLGRDEEIRLKTHETPPHRRKTYDRIGKYVGPVARFTAGMAMLPPFLLVKQVLLKVVLTMAFAILALLSGKRLRWGYFLILLVSVSFFQLFFPWGRVITEFGPIVVTAGAMESGLIRGLTLVGMVFLSVAAVRSELELPGAIGGLLSRTFYYFDLLFEGRRQLSRKNFFASLDDLLKERFDLGREHMTVTKRGGGKMKGWFMAFLAALIPWFLFIWAQLSGQV